MQNPITWLLDAQLTIAGHDIYWREIIGNLFGLASAVGGMRRRVWAWPVGIAGNVLLFTVFLGGVFHTAQGTNLLGQAGRQVMFVVVSIYGWYRWYQSRGSGAPAVIPRWATMPERLGMLAVAAIGVGVLTPVFRALGSYEPVWADAWIFTGSLLATFAMAKGWVEFWLVWIGVDLVGVPLLLRAHFYPSATLYAIYGAFVIWGFVVWLRVAREPAPAPAVAVQQAAS
jgi:nicotinamide mononucleotide transporter